MSKHDHTHSFRSIVAASAIAALVTVFAAPATAEAKPPGGGGPSTSTTTTVPLTYTGRAYGLSAAATALVTLVKTAITLSDTGTLTGPGEADRQLVSVNTGAVAGVSLNADIVSAITVASGLQTDSTAETVGLTGSVGQVVDVSADVLLANATSTCSATTAATSSVGRSTLANVVIKVLGSPVSIPINPAPNTTIAVGTLVKIVLNEQYVTNGVLTVNALHVTVNGSGSPLSTVATADVVISHAEAGITCQLVTTPGGGTPPPPPPCPVLDFMTGGGTLTSSTGAKVSFGFNGGLKNPGLMGHFNAIDHGNGNHLQGSSVTAYSVTGTTSRQITYDSGGIVVNAADNGEPGTSDTISFAGYSGNPISTGNIQLHKPSGCLQTSDPTGGPKKH